MADVRYYQHTALSGALADDDRVPMDKKTGSTTFATRHFTPLQMAEYVQGTLGAAAVSNDYNDLDNLPSLFDGAFASLTGKPTTLSGYGITDAYPLVGNPSGFLTSAPVTSVFGRTGAVVAVTNDYTWAQIDKTTSSLADIATRSASDLSSGTLAAARGGAGTVSGIMKANGSGVVSAAVAGTDYEVPITFSTGLTRSLNTVTVDTSVIATKAYADSLVVGLLDDRGNYDASGNVFPSSGGSGTAGAVLKGDLWTVSVAGTLGGVAVTAGDLVRALVDTPGQTAGNWAVSETNIGYTALNASLLSGKFYVGNGSNIGAAVTPTGDVTFDNAGVFTIGAAKVTNAMLAGSITAAKLVKTDITTVGTITSGGLGAGAVIGGVTMTLGSDADGDIYYRSSNVLTRLPKGTALQGLRMNAGATAPEWAAITATLTVGSSAIGSGSAGRFLYETSGNVLGEVTTLTSDGTIITFAPTVTTGTGATAGVVGTANNLTTGNGFDFSSSSASSGKLFSLAITGTAALTNNTVLNISNSGATSTNAQTTYGAQISNTRTNATSGTNVALNLVASGATTANWPLQVNGGITWSGANVTLYTGSTRVLNADPSNFAIDTDVWIKGGNVRLRGPSAGRLALGAVDAASPVAQTLSVQNVVTGTSNTAGTDFTISGSQSTGSAAGGSIVFKTSPAGSTGTSVNALVTALTINSAGQLVTGAGTASAPAVAVGATNSGLSLASSGLVLSAGGQNSAAFYSALFYMKSTTVLGWTSDSGVTNGDTFLRRASAANIRHGDSDAASPVNQTISTQGSRSGTDTNVAGANLTIQSGLGTGSSTPSSLILQSPLIGSTGTTAQTAVTGLTVINGTARLTSYTVATLPSPTVAGDGALAMVTDATLTVITGLGLAPTGGGSNIVPVYVAGGVWLMF